MRTRLIAAAWTMAALLLPSAAAAQQPITVLTGGLSGVYYPLGVTIAKIYADIPDSRVRVETTDGSVENLMRLQHGTAQIAFALGDSLRDAWAGDAEAGFKGKLDRLRVIGAMYPSYIQIVATKASGIRTLANLKGKSVSVGDVKSGTELNARAIFAAAGLDEKDMGRIDHLAFKDSTLAMNKKQLDATLQSAGLGVVSIKELSAATDIAMIPVPKEVVEKMGAPFVPGIIPAKTYFGQDEDTPTASVMNYLVTSSAVSDDLAYQLTRLVYDSLPKLSVAHFVGAEIKREKAAESGPVPLHPGAIRFYKEVGLLK